METQEDCELLNKKYEDAQKKIIEWESSLGKRFTKEEENDIIYMVSYLSNQKNGFGHFNDEQLYLNIRYNDTYGTLYTEAKIGFEYSQAYIELGMIIKDWERKNKNTNF